MFIKNEGVSTSGVGSRVRLNRDLRVQGGVFTEDHEFTIKAIYCGEGEGDDYKLEDDAGNIVDEVDADMVRPASVSNRGFKKSWYKLCSWQAVSDFGKLRVKGNPISLRKQ